MEDNIIASFSRNKSASLDFVNKYETVNIDTETTHTRDFSHELVVTYVK